MSASNTDSVKNKAEEPQKKSPVSSTSLPVLRYNPFNIYPPSLIFEQDESKTKIFVRESLAKPRKQIALIHNLEPIGGGFSADYIGQNLYVLEKSHSGNDVRSVISKYNHGIKVADIPNTNDLLGFMVSPNEEYILVHTMPEESDGLINVIDKNGKELLRLSNGTDGTEQTYDAQILGWSSDTNYLYYSTGDYLIKVHVSSWKSEKFDLNRFSLDGYQRFNIEAGLIAHTNSSDEEPDQEIFVSSFVTGKTVQFANSTEASFYLSWISKDHLAIVNRKTGTYKSILIDVKQLQ